MKKKGLLAVILLLTLVAGAAIGGTAAYLAASSNEVENTFTYGDINIKLAEHDDGIDNGELDTGIVTTRDPIKLLPGLKAPKDPFVTVKHDSEKCWLFVQVTPTDWPAGGEGWYQVNTDDGNWTVLDAGSGIYYRIVDTNAADQQFYILRGEDPNTNGEISVPTTVKKGEITGTPKLKFAAWAIQHEGFDTALAAWNAKGDAVLSTTW